MRSLENLAVMISGAGKRPGAEIAAHLSDSGMKIAAVDTTPVLLDDLQTRIRNSSGVCHTYVCDMAKKRFVQGTLEQIRDDFGTLDAVILAGFVNPSGDLFSLDEWEWQRALDVNLSGVFFTLQSCARISREQPAGMDAVLLIPGASHPARNISRQALRALAQESSRAFSPYHLRVNAIQENGISPDELSRQITYLLRTPDESGDQ